MRGREEKREREGKRRRGGREGRGRGRGEEGKWYVRREEALGRFDLSSVKLHLFVVYHTSKNKLIQYMRRVICKGERGRGREERRERM